MHKQVRSRYIEKRINLRIEHVKHSNCRLDFLNRVKKNAELKKEAKAKGISIDVKRQPVQPRTAHYVSSKGNIPTTISPVPYEALV